MKRIWLFIEKQSCTAASKYRLALLILGALYSLWGFAFWLIIRLWAFSTWDWLISFTGYPVIISTFVVFFYSCNHAFHNGRSECQSD